jgi:hypothetical protein
MSRANKFFLILGIILLCAGTAYGVTSLWFVKNGNSAAGTVIELKKIDLSGSGHQGTAYAPVVEFTNSKGETITFTHRISGNINPGPGQNTKPPYQKGDKVTVLYDPQNPEDATLRDPVSLWLFPAAFLGIGMLLLLGVWNGVRKKAQ